VTPGGVSPSLLRLLQLTSPALPIGAFAYSQGLEHAVEARWVHDEASAAAWILGLVSQVLTQVEVPYLVRLMEAFTAGADPGVWSQALLASRGSAELRAEELRLGSALCRLLVTLEVPGAGDWEGGLPTHLAMFALAAARWHIPVAEAAGGYLFSWCENQVGAAARLVPLGQSAAQRILSRATELIPEGVATGLALPDDQIGFSAPAHGIGAALHETQYSRIFRS
jgi:urease accessory protein